MLLCFTVPPGRYESACFLSFASFGKWKTDFFFFFAVFMEDRGVLYIFWVHILLVRLRILYFQILMVCILFSMNCLFESLIFFLLHSITFFLLIYKNIFNTMKMSHYLVPNVSNNFSYFAGFLWTSLIVDFAPEQFYIFCKIIFIYSFSLPMLSLIQCL